MKFKTSHRKQASAKRKQRNKTKRDWGNPFGRVSRRVRQAKPSQDLNRAEIREVKRALAKARRARRGGLSFRQYDRLRRSATTPRPGGLEA